MTPTRRKPEKKIKPEKSIGTPGALSSNNAPTPAAEGGEAAKKPAATKRPSAAKGGSKKLTIALAVLTILIVLVACAFSWYRWAHGNDTIDVQGTWYVNGSDAAITITEDEIILAENVTYTYTIDPTSKSIEFFFSDLSGCGHYRFSIDRGELAIIDGECSSLDSILSDFGWLMGALFFELQGKEAAPAEAEGSMLLSREPVTLIEEAPADGETDGEAADGDATGEGETSESDDSASSEEATDGAA